MSKTETGKTNQIKPIWAKLMLKEATLGKYEKNHKSKMAKNHIHHYELRHILTRS